MKSTPPTGARLRPAAALIIAALGGIAVGLFAGGFRAKHRTPPLEPSAESAASAEAPARSLSAKPPVDSRSAGLRALPASKRTTERLALVQELVETVGDDDIPAALAKYKELQGYQVQQEYVRLLLERWAARDPAAALAWIRQSFPEGHTQRGLIRQVLTYLAEREPQSAASMLVDLPGPLSQEMALAVASAWGRNDPEAAAAWAKTLPEGSARDEAIFSISADWAAANPLSAAEYARTLPAERRQAEMLNIIGMQWGRHDPAGAVTWAQQLPEGQAREQFLAGLSSTWAETSPVKAAELVALMAPGNSQNEAVVTVVIEWARNDPAAAAEWVKMFPAGAVREKALCNLVAIWAEADAGATSAFFRNWPEGAERDRAVRHFLDQILETEAGRGAEVVQAIADPLLRQEQTERVAQHWLMQNPQAARAWIAQAPLSDVSKERLLKP